MAGTFLLLDYGEDICSPVLLAVVIAGGVSVNETSTAFWHPFFSALIWPYFVGDNVSEYNCFVLDKHYKLKFSFFRPMN